MRAEQEAEFRQYVAARADRLRRFGHLCCGDWQRAEDAVQTAFVKLYGIWPKKSVGSFDAYVRRIVANTLIDEHRRGWFRRERASELLPDRIVPDGSDTSVETMVIMSALARLPKRQRAVVVLRYCLPELENDGADEGTDRFKLVAPGAEDSRFGFTHRVNRLVQLDSITRSDTTRHGTARVSPRTDTSSKAATRTTSTTRTRAPATTGGSASTARRPPARTVNAS